MACADVSFLGDTKKVLLLLEVVGGEFSLLLLLLFKSDPFSFVPENDFPPRLSRFKIHLFLIQTRNPARSEEHFATVRGR